MARRNCVCAAAQKEDQASAWEMLKLEPKSDAEAFWLTEFEDRASPRPGTADSYFSPAIGQKRGRTTAHRAICLHAGPADRSVVYDAGGGTAALWRCTTSARMPVS